MTLIVASEVAKQIGCAPSTILRLHKESKITAAGQRPRGRGVQPLFDLEAVTREIEQSGVKLRGGASRPEPEAEGSDSELNEEEQAVAHEIASAAACATLRFARKKAAAAHERGDIDQEILFVQAYLNTLTEAKQDELDITPRYSLPAAPPAGGGE
jgi:hypothetical protein